MSSRSLPYRAKPSELDLKLIDIISTTARFLLLSQPGPTQFLLREASASAREAVKYKVSIGSIQKCTCHKKPRLCLHILFVMIKVLKVPSEDPLTWQHALIDSEVTQILQRRFDRAKKKVQKKENKRNSGLIERRSLDEDADCPICQEEMTFKYRSKKDVLVYCAAGCGNNVHAKCMQVWAQHRITIKQPITCPLCRTDWGSNALQEVKRQVDIAVKGIKKRRAEVKRVLRCARCNAFVSKYEDRFHCIYCPTVTLCKSCHNSAESFAASRQPAAAMVLFGQPDFAQQKKPAAFSYTCNFMHGKDIAWHTFIKKSGISLAEASQQPSSSSQHQMYALEETKTYAQWEAPAPSAEEKKRMEQERVAHQQALLALQSRELDSNDLALLHSFAQQDNHVPLYTYLLEQLPEADEDGKQAYEQCVLCEQTVGVELSRVLFCDHVVHTDCVAAALSENVGLLCPRCRAPVFPGLQPMQRKKVHRQQPSSAVVQATSSAQRRTVDQLANQMSPFVLAGNALIPRNDLVQSARRSDESRLRIRGDRNSWSNQSSSMSVSGSGIEASSSQPSHLFSWTTTESKRRILPQHRGQLLSSTRTSLRAPRQQPVRSAPQIDDTAHLGAPSAPTTSHRKKGRLRLGRVKSASASNREFITEQNRNIQSIEPVAAVRRHPTLPMSRGRIKSSLRGRMDRPAARVQSFDADLSLQGQHFAH